MRDIEYLVGLPYDKVARSLTEKNIAFTTEVTEPVSRFFKLRNTYYVVRIREEEVGLRLVLNKTLVFEDPAVQGFHVSRKEE